MKLEKYELKSGQELKVFDPCKTKKLIEMHPKEINTKKKPIVKIDKSLDFFNDKPLFPEKVEKANEMLKKIGLPFLKNPRSQQEV